LPRYSAVIEFLNNVEYLINKYCNNNNNNNNNNNIQIRQQKENTLKMYQISLKKANTV